MVGFLGNHGKATCIINMYRNTGGEADGNSQISLFPGLFTVPGLRGKSWSNTGANYFHPPMNPRD